MAVYRYKYGRVGNLRHWATKIRSNKHYGALESQFQLLQWFGKFIIHFFLPPDTEYLAKFIILPIHLAVICYDLQGQPKKVISKEFFLNFITMQINVDGIPERHATHSL